MNKISNGDRRGAIADSLRMLKEGNGRFASGLRSAAALSSFDRIKDLAKNGQAPFASLLACADSRVPAELVFDCGLGELFVCRVAGTVATSWMIGSLEYSAVVLGTPLTVVMGHTQCGAVEAAVRHVEGLEVGVRSRHIARLARSIAPAVKAVHAAAPAAAYKEILRDTWFENSRHQMREVLAHSPLLRKLRKEGRWDIVAATYNLETGEVRFEDAAPAAGPKGKAASARRPVGV